MGTLLKDAKTHHVHVQNSVPATCWRPSSPENRRHQHGLHKSGNGSGAGDGERKSGGGERIGYVRCLPGGASVLNESAPLAWFLVLMNLDGWGGEPPNPSKEHLAPPPLGLDHARSLLRNEASVLRLGLVSRSEFPRGEGGEGGESGAPISRGVSGGGIAALAAAAAAAAAADPVVAG